MREYELTVVYDLAVMEAGGADASVQNLTTHVQNRGGAVVKVDHWGRRRMAYPIGRAIDGDYVVSRVELDPGSVVALEEALRIDEKVFRHLVVRADELPVPPPPREPRREAPSAQAPVAAPAPAAPAEAVAAAPEPVAAAPEPVAAATKPVAEEPADEPAQATAEAESPAAEPAE